MTRQESACVVDRRRYRRWLLPGAVAFLAAFFFALGVNCLWHHFRDGSPRLYRAPAGVLLVAIGIVQWRVARLLWNRRHVDARPWQPLGGPLLWQWLLIGMAASYFTGLLLGPGPYVRYFFRASVGLWITVAMLPLVVDRSTLRRCTQWSNREPFRAVRRLALVVSLSFVTVEATLRAYCFVSGDNLPVTYVAGGLKLPPGADRRGQTVNQHGYWDGEFDADSRAGRLRVAVLGDDAALSGTAESNCLARVEAMMPNLEVFNFGLASAGPREYAAQFSHEVLGYHPDLVLILLSVGDDVTQRIPLPSLYDWRGLHSYQLGARSWGWSRDARVSQASRSVPTTDFESYLHAAAARMAVCRTPIDEATHRHWEETTASLDKIADRCQRRGIALALVLVPDDYQLDAALLRTLTRRIGCGREDLDLELPQRRLTRYAGRRQLPVLDLLPHFRAAEAPTYDRHSHLWNDHGNAVAAEVISAWLRTRYGTMLASTVAVRSAGN